MELSEMMQYRKEARTHENEDYTEYTCSLYSNIHLMDNESFMKDIYSHFNKRPLDIYNNECESYRALDDYTNGASQMINSQLHSNEELIKSNNHMYSDEYFKIRKFLEKYHTESPIITYRIISEEYVKDAIEKKNFFQGLVSTGCVLNSLIKSSGACYAKSSERVLIRIYVPKNINCIMLPKRVAVCPEDVEILILDGYNEYEIEETEEKCDLKGCEAKVYNLYLKEPKQR